MSLYKQFETDEALEVNGVTVDYGDFRITIARAGGRNKKFARTLEAKSKPHRRAIQAGTLDNEKALDLLREAYSEAIVTNWETKDEEGRWKKGIEAPEGDKLLPFAPGNVLKTFRNLPDLFLDVQSQASGIDLYRLEVLEVDAGN